VRRLARRQRTLAPHAPAERTLAPHARVFLKGRTRLQARARVASRPRACLEMAATTIALCFRPATSANCAMRTARTRFVLQRFTKKQNFDFERNLW